MLSFVEFAYQNVFDVYFAGYPKKSRYTVDNETSAQTPRIAWFDFSGSQKPWSWKGTSLFSDKRGFTQEVLASSQYSVAAS